MKSFATSFILSIAAPAFAIDPAALYETHCARCHGADLRGGNATSLLDGAWGFGDGAGHILRNIKFGITDLGMPAFEGALSDAELKALTSFLLEAEEQANPVAPPLPTRLRTLDHEITVEVFADGLDTPWDIAFLDEDVALITERPGTLRVYANGTLYTAPVGNTPTVLAEGQGGLLAVAFDPDYKEEDNQWVYLAYAHGLPPEPNGRRAGSMTRVVRGRVDGNGWTNEQVVFEAPAESYRTSRAHYGTRIVFDADKNLLFSIGDRGTGAHAQDLAKPNGKIHRVTRDGNIPRDNPFRRVDGALPTIFSLGHRNPQGLARHPETGDLWASEHGPLGGDEINLVIQGRNYGWPLITYGRNYNGSVISEDRAREGLEQPIWFWNPSTAVSGMDFHSGERFTKWKNKLLVGSLKYEDVRVLTIQNDRVIHEEIILKNAGRVRTVRVGPDGAVYVVLNDPGTILKLTPLE